MKPLNIGSLEHYVTIQAPYYTSSASGNTATWVDIPNAGVWAAMKPLRGREAYYAGRPDARHTFKFRVHYNRFLATDHMPATYPTDNLLAFYGFEEDPSDTTRIQDRWGSYDAVNTNMDWVTGGLKSVVASTDVALDSALSPSSGITFTCIARQDGATQDYAYLYRSSWDAGNFAINLLMRQDAGRIYLIGTGNGTAFQTSTDAEYFVADEYNYMSFGVNWETNSYWLYCYNDTAGADYKTGSYIALAGSPVALDSGYPRLDSWTWTVAQAAVHSDTTYSSGRYLASLAPWAKRVHGIDLGIGGGFPTPHQMRIKYGRRYFYIDERINVGEDDSYIDLIAVEGDA